MVFLLFSLVVLTIFQAILGGIGLDNDGDLENTIKKLEGELKKARKKDADGDEPEVRFMMSCCFCPLILALC